VKLEKEAKRCPNCSLPVRPQDAYCENCGFRLGERTSLENLVTNTKTLEEENQDLREKLRKATRRPSRLAGLGLSALGFTALTISILFESSILAFIGLGLTFWGVLLLFVRTTHYVKSQLLDATSRPYYVAVERLLDHLEYEGHPVYLPPRQLKTLKVGTIFIAAEKNEEIDYYKLSEDLQAEQLFIQIPSGVCLFAPGVGLANLLEEEIGKDFTKESLDDLQRDLPSAIIEGFELAEGVEIEVEGEAVVVKIMSSLYEAFYEDAGERLKRIGCPLVSAIALALTRATGQPIFVDEIKPEPESRKMIVRYVVLRGVER